MNATALNRIKRLEVANGGDISRQLPMIVSFDRVEADWTPEEKQAAEKYRLQGYSATSQIEFLDNCV